MTKYNKTNLPKLGQSSQLGLSTPARHASQNHGIVEQELTVLETLSFSDTPQQPDTEIILYGQSNWTSQITVVYYKNNFGKWKQIKIP